MRSRGGLLAQPNPEERAEHPAPSVSSRNGTLWFYADVHTIMTSSLPGGILVPRPETEELVELCLRDLRPYSEATAPEEQEQRGSSSSSSSSGLRVLDVGVGTGAIGLALLNARPDLHVDGIDLELAAVELALRNAEKLGVEARYRCLEMDVQDAAALLGTPSPLALPSAPTPTPTPTPAANAPAAAARPLYDMVVSNPPYIPERDAAIMQPEVLLYEKDTALFSGALGMDCIEVLLTVAPRLLASGGSLWLEIDPSQPSLIEQAVSAAEGVPLTYIAAHKDFRGLDRFVHLIKK